MLTGEAEWRSAETEEGVVELLQSPPRIPLHPVVPELPNHQFPQGVVEVTGIPGAALRLSFRGQAIQVRILHRSEEHTSELQSRFDLVCRLLLEKKNEV